MDATTHISMPWQKIHSRLSSRYRKREYLQSIPVTFFTLEAQLFLRHQRLPHREHCINHEHLFFDFGAHLADKAVCLNYKHFFFTLGR